MLLAVDTLAFKDCVKSGWRVSRKIAMTNPPWTLGDAEHLSKWTSGVCGSSSWCLGELNLVVNEAQNVMEKQAPLPSHSAGPLAGKCLNKEVVPVQLPEGTEPL